jgi:hypothetical protein
MQSINIDSLRKLNAKLLVEIERRMLRFLNLKKRMLSSRIRMPRSMILKGSSLKLRLRELNSRPRLPSF